MSFQTILHYEFIAILILYLAATVLFSLRIVSHKKEWSILGLKLVIFTFSLHALGLLIHFFQVGYPFLTTSFESWQLIAIGLVTAYLILSTRYSFVSTGIFIFPLVLVFYILSLSSIVDYEGFNPMWNNPWAFIHLIFILMAMIHFLISMINGFLYLARAYRIKHKKWGGIWENLPSLEVLDNLHFRALSIGFVFFTIGMIFGAGWSKSMLGHYITQDTKQILSFIVWIYFALFLNLRVFKGWVGQRGVVISSLGYILVLCLLIWVGV